MEKFFVKYNKIKQLIINEKILLAILLIALLLRIAGIGYGFPLFLIIDEPTTVFTAFKFGTTLNPGRFDWPSFHFYFYGLFIVATKMIIIVAEKLGVANNYLMSDIPYFLISRIVSVIVSLFTTYFIYLSSLKLYTKNFALLSALFFAITPMAVYEGHFFRPDIMLMLMTSVYIYQNIRIFIEKKHNLSDYIYLGIIMGFAVSSKYNAFLLAIISVMFWIVYYDKSINIRSYIKNFIIAIVTSIITFLLLNPFVIIDFKHFWSTEPTVGILWQFENLGKVNQADYVSRFLEVFGYELVANLSLGLAMILLLNFIFFTFFNYRSKLSIVFNISILFSILYIIQFKRSPSYYFLYLLPLFILAITNILYDFKLTKFYKRMIFEYLLVLLVFIAFISSGYTAIKFIRNDSRAVLYSYLKTNNFSNQKIVISGEAMDILDLKFINDVTNEKTIEESTLEYTNDFYVIIGDTNTIRNSMIAEIEPNGLDEDQTGFYSRAELVKFISKDLRFGPDIFIYKVSGIINK